MPRAKHYLDIDVVTAAHERVEHIYDLFDNTVVMFSGGKDSLAVLHLVKEFHEKHDLGKIKVCFRHEEVINPSVLRFVEPFRHLDWMELYWFCFPNLNSKFVMGKREEYIEWDPTREWVGEQPEWAITAKELGIPEDGSISQYSVDDIVVNYLGLKGKVAHITGIRASESLVRFRSVTQKLNENYISSIEHNERSRVKLCKPIYDWELEDVLKYLYEKNVEWCPLYENQELASMGLRVSTALHVSAAKKLDKLQAVEPEFYNQIAKIFPDIQDQARYWHDFDKAGLLKEYRDRGWEGIESYIQENLSEKEQKQARERVELWKKRNATDPENYPVEDMLDLVASGNLDHRLTGRYVNSKAYKGKK